MQIKFYLIYYKKYANEFDLKRMSIYQLLLSYTIWI